MKEKQINKTLALAGIFQAASLVKNFALNGQLDETAFKSSLHSVFKIDATNVAEIFGDINQLEIGLMTVVQFGQKQPKFKDSALLQYVLYMMNLGKNLLRNHNAKKQLSRKLETAISQATHFRADHPMVLHTLSTIYQRIFVENQQRIPVIGRVDILKQNDLVEKIRSLLLAGIRAALLWYQVGGNRWDLFFARRKYSKTAYALLNPPLTHFMSVSK